MRSTRSEFSKATKEMALWTTIQQTANGKEDFHCDKCHQPLAGRQPEYDHYPVPAALDGDNSIHNCRVLCPKCHREVTKTETVPMVSKSKRILEKRAGLRRSRHRLQSRGFQ